MSKYLVTYSVKFVTEVEVTDGETVEDVVSDIEIPENDESTYCADSYQTYDVKQIN